MYDEYSNEKHDMCISSLSRHAEIRAAQQVFTETFNEIPSTKKREIRSNLNRIFGLWQEQQGVYPPRPHKLVRTARSLLHGEDYPAPQSYREYILNVSEKEKSLIKPWECDEGARSAADLLYKLFAENYEPLQHYLNDKKSPRFDHVLSVAIAISIKANPENEPLMMAYWGVKLVGIREEIQKSLVEKSKLLLSKEKNRVEGRVNRAILQKAEAKKRIKKALIKFAKSESGLPKPLHESLAKEAGIGRPSVTRYLQSMRKDDDEIRKILSLSRKKCS
ncbi:MAG: hypothetical protein CL570_04335 [Alphaproteobacteria bacterium]|nr:hypothetical protein [Alphaproteobacteria bacterium]|tara:strand:+ start:1296 stop:2126 length:831 start_codon:yes stop_codon:yes gene_type:complete